MWGICDVSVVCVVFWYVSSVCGPVFCMCAVCEMCVVFVVYVWCLCFLHSVLVVYMCFMYGV